MLTPGRKNLLGALALVAWMAGWPDGVCGQEVAGTEGASGRAARAQALPPLQDNSFLVEEAYNQERGVVQHALTWELQPGRGTWTATFAQEWPLPSQRHQLSYSLPASRIEQGTGHASGIGDAGVHYRLQVGGGAWALAPRLSVLLPLGDERRALGTGGFGVQSNLPISVTWGPRFVTHTNLGLTWHPRARNEPGERAAVRGYSAGQSVVWLARPRFNLLLEAVWVREGAVTAPGVARASDEAFASPGARWRFDCEGGTQVVPGIAFPVGVGPTAGHRGVYAYLSVEHSFRRPRR